MSANYRHNKGRILSPAWIACLIFVIFSMQSTAYSALNETQDKSVLYANTIVTKLIKLGASGEPVEADAQQWSCVMDLSTGLMWEKRDPTTALHGHDSYIWYQPEHSNPGNQRAHPDFVLGDSTCYGFDANDPASFCNTSAYADRVNQSNYCGYSDWRLPTANELLSLVDDQRKKNKVAPLLDTRFFPFHDPFLYWTNTVNQDDIVVTIFADDKVLENSERSDTISVRLVRGN